jgi:hypothetical protein
MPESITIDEATCTGGRVVQFVLCIYERETPQMVSTLRNYAVKYGSYLEVHADIRLKTQ